MEQILILPALQSSAHTKLPATMENELSSQLEKKIRSYGGTFFTSVLILGASINNQHSIQVVLTQQQILTAQQTLKTQQDSQEKGCSFSFFCNTLTSS
jgi:hypothetical protein